MNRFTAGHHTRRRITTTEEREMLALAASFSLSLTVMSMSTAAQPTPTQLVATSSMGLSRRVLLSAAAAAISTLPPRTAEAANDVPKARAQMDASAVALDDLIKRYEQVIADDGGNGVRRVLGKLGPTSPLHRVDKACSLVARELEDDRTFDLVDEFLGQIDAADGDAYSSIFVPTGGGTTPAYWLARSRKEIVKARATLGLLLELQ